MLRGMTKRHFHGHGGRQHSPTYTVWHSMKQRCLNPNSRAYPNYGGRGISVCERWLEFPNFLADMGERPAPELTLDRIDGNKGYEPGNCRWVTRKVQCNNWTRRQRYVTYRGERFTVQQLADKLGLGRYTLVRRMDYNWPQELWHLPPDRTRRGIGYSVS